MDPQAIAQNEKLLGDLLDNGDKKFVALVGVTALGVLTEQLDPEQYQAFLQECIENAHDIQKHKSLNAKQPQQQEQQTTQGQPPASGETATA